MSVIEIPLFEPGTEASDGWARDEEWVDIYWSDKPVLRNVRVPTLTLFTPAQCNGTAVILAPGGGWHYLAMEHEGYAVARKLNELGIVAGVLKYRLKQFDDPREQEQNLGTPQARAALLAEMGPLILRDGQQALSIMRSRGEALGVTQTGIMGYSAGGYVALGVAGSTTGEAPDFAVGIYTAAPEIEETDRPLPPLLLMCTSDDEMAWKNSLKLYETWQERNSSVGMHIFEKGGHGFCLRQTGTTTDQWFDHLVAWLRSMTLIPAR